MTTGSIMNTSSIDVHGGNSGITSFQCARMLGSKFFLRDLHKVCLVVVVDFEFPEVLFDRLDLGGIKDVLMGAYHRFGAGRPPFNPLGLLRFKVVLVLKGYRSQKPREPSER